MASTARDDQPLTLAQRLAQSLTRDPGKLARMRVEGLVTELKPAAEALTLVPHVRSWVAPFRPRGKQAAPPPQRARGALVIMVDKAGVNTVQGLTQVMCAIASRAQDACAQARLHSACSLRSTGTNMHVVLPVEPEAQEPAWRAIMALCTAAVPTYTALGGVGGCGKVLVQLRLQLRNGATAAQVATQVRALGMHAMSQECEAWLKVCVPGQGTALWHHAMALVPPAPPAVHAVPTGGQECMKATPAEVVSCMHVTTSATCVPCSAAPAAEPLAPAPGLTVVPSVSADGQVQACVLAGTHAQLLGWALHLQVAAPWAKPELAALAPDSAEERQVTWPHANALRAAIAAGAWTSAGLAPELADKVTATPQQLCGVCGGPHAAPVCPRGPLAAAASGDICAVAALTTAAAAQETRWVAAQPSTEMLHLRQQAAAARALFRCRQPAQPESRARSPRTVPRAQTPTAKLLRPLPNGAPAYAQDAHMRAQELGMPQELADKLLEVLAQRPPDAVVAQALATPTADGAIAIREARADWLKSQREALQDVSKDALQGHRQRARKVLGLVFMAACARHTTSPPVVPPSASAQDSGTAAPSLPQTSGNAAVTATMTGEEAADTVAMAANTVTIAANTAAMTTITTAMTANTAATGANNADTIAANIADDATDGRHSAPQSATSPPHLPARAALTRAERVPTPAPMPEHTAVALGSVSPDQPLPSHAGATVAPTSRDISAASDDVGAGTAGTVPKPAGSPDARAVQQGPPRTSPDTTASRSAAGQRGRPPRPATASRASAATTRTTRSASRSSLRSRDRR